MVIGLISSELFATPPLTRTYTINEETLHQIRKSAGRIYNELGDEFITKYWDEYTCSTRDENPDLGFFQRDRAFTDSFGIEDKVIDVYIAVVDFENPTIDYTQQLDDIRTYLYQFPWEIYQNALKNQDYYPTVEPIPSAVPNGWDIEPPNNVTGEDEAWWQLSDYQRAREMSFNLILMSYIVDMLYYAHDRTDPTTDEYIQFESILAHLQAHLLWIHETFFGYGLDQTNNWDTRGWNVIDKYTMDDSVTEIAPKGMCDDDNGPGGGVSLPQLSISNSNSRFHLICGMGYASLLTGQDDMLDSFVRNEFKSDGFLPVDTPFHGFNDYLTTNSGAFVAGITYQNRLLYLSNLFFTALNRFRGINLYNNNNQWNCDMLPRMVRYTLKRIDPELHHITFGDDWRYNGVNSAGADNEDMDHSIQIERGLLSFYYQNTDDPWTQNDIRWYVNELKNKSGNWPREMWENDLVSSFEVVMNYQANSMGGPVPVTNEGTFPSFLQNGTYSNAESTLMRNPTNNYDEYKNTHMLVVNHENSFIPCMNNDDNTSYQLYLWGNPVIVEAGYTAYDGVAIYEDWYRSSFSQNVLLIDPEKPQSAGLYLESDFLSLPSAMTHNVKISYEDPMNVFTEPMGVNWLTTNQETKPYHEKARKEFLLKHGNSLTGNGIEHLKINFRYNNSKSTTFDSTPVVADEQENPCMVYRNFYKIADRYFIIRDLAMFENPQTESNAFRNQMNLLTNVRRFGYRNLQYWVRARSAYPGVYQSYDLVNTKGMFIALGSSIAGVNSYELSSPDVTKLAWTPKDWVAETPNGRLGSMRRLSLTASSTNDQESFITFIYPCVSNYSYNPVTEAIQDLSGYRFIISEETKRILVALGSNESVEFPSSAYQMNSNGDFIVLNSESDLSSQHEMILSKGSYLSVSHTEGSNVTTKVVFESLDSDLEEVIASWSGQDLFVTTKANSPLYPKYKILRGNVAPLQLYSKTDYSNIETTGTISYNINSLSYDNQYFYVNYTWDDLCAADLINDDLVLVQATIPGAVISTDLNLQGFISITGDISICNGASMDIFPNSAVTISEGVHIYNHGTLTLDGESSNSINIDRVSQAWSGITTYRDGSFFCNEAIIQGAETGVHIRGASVITNSEITACHNGISIETATPFSITNNIIHGNTYGIFISNNYTTSEIGSIQNNELTQNGTGVLLYNSNTKLAMNDIHDNTRSGVYLLRGSNPIIKDCNISDTELNGISRPEILLESESYPIIDDFRNDINLDGFGYSLYYHTTDRIMQLMARNNYWGFTNSFGIRQSIYPLDWDVAYDPFSLEPNTFFPHLGDNLFKQAMIAEESGDVNLAKQLYTTVVESDPDSLYALQSLGRLNSLYSDSPYLLNELRTIYSTFYASSSDTTLIKNAQLIEIMLDRFEGLYLDALQEYEDQLVTSTTEMDSLLYLLDIAYTLQDMYYDDLSKGYNHAIAYNSHGLCISTLKDAKHSIDQLWVDILEKSIATTTGDFPVPTKLDLANYPNPFNPSTNIDFGIPTSGKVKLCIYNLKGQKVIELVNAAMERGYHTIVWDGKDSLNRSVASGMYFCRLESGSLTATRKMLLMK